MKMLQKNKSLLVSLLAIGIVFIMVAVIPHNIFALQSLPVPALPSSPEQSPLGGLAVLAGAGGMYAIKKLHNKE